MKIKSIEGGVCAAKGFRAAGVPAEIKYKGRNDVALVVADAPCAAAAVFTTNAVAAAPVVYDREVVRGGRIQTPARARRALPTRSAAPRRRRRRSASIRSSCSSRPRA